ncbi:hypothetical protein CLU79DRAFT_833294 [Phycomyces nitens]|nr:hypothetical protein CLU79DRAFT_833294 [Phycomyces nitens]
MHGKVPSRQQLFSHNITNVDDPQCVLCGELEDDEHLFWACVSKKPIWEQVTTRFLESPTSLTFDHLLLPSSLLSVEVSNTTAFSYIVLGCTLGAIWEAHFQYVFNDVPFVTNQIAAIATLNIRRLELEESLQSTP